MRAAFAFIFALSAFACGPAQDRGPVAIAVIGEDDDLFGTGIRLSPAAQHLRAASNEGLVALDPSGQVVPAIAERWIVTDDGLSYIFRLRNSNWADGAPITSNSIRLMLQDRLRELEGTSLGLDLAKVVEVRAMTGRVIELRLSGPMPQFLRLLAQPELGFTIRRIGAGPMSVSREEGSSIAQLTMLPPENRGLPARTDWEERTRGLALQNLSARQAIDGFSDGTIDLVLNGSIADFPMIEFGPLSRGAIQVDPAIGLFGLTVRNDNGLLSDPNLREALSLAIDREALIQPFGLGGWVSTTWIVPPELFVSGPLAVSRWPDLDLEQRRAIARQRIAGFGRQDATISVGLPDGPGGDLLFDGLSSSWRSIGVTTQRVGIGEGGDLELTDRLARYSSPRWFVNQMNCTIAPGLCSEEADALVRDSLELKDPESKELLLIEAHSILTEAEVFIPLGVPVRWSLVRGSVEGYQANPWGLHPLSALAEVPN